MRGLSDRVARRWPLQRNYVTKLGYPTADRKMNRDYRSSSEISQKPKEKEVWYAWHSYSIDTAAQRQSIAENWFSPVPNSWSHIWRMIERPKMPAASARHEKRQLVDMDQAEMLEADFGRLGNIYREIAVEC
jgi:hypothetical protein